MLPSLLLITRLAPAAAAAEEHVGPAWVEAAADLQPAGAWRVSPVRTADRPGSRVAVLAQSLPGHDTPTLYARGVGGAGEVGPWVALPSLWAIDGAAVAAADLGATWPAAQVGVQGRDASLLIDVGWSLSWPRYEPPTVFEPAPPASLPSELTAIGVVSRSSWGASATTCTSLEDEWYRFAIHHTAGSQTYGGTVEGSVQALQSYSLSTGDYCDIPYQFLVGYDGSLWEGRPYGYYSGATGGGNNDGNFAVCFLGCYHGSGCSTSHDATDEMMDGAQTLVQTLADLHGIVTTSETLKGHQDWPGNATACPGDYVYERLDELMEPLTAPDLYAGSLVLSESGAADAPLLATVGQPLSVRFVVQNSGTTTWNPHSTRLGTIPRDTESALADASWPYAHRPAAVAASTAPGAQGEFSFTVTAPSAGIWTLELGMVEEWVTWFADAPTGGGPADGTLVVVIDAQEPPDTGGDGGQSGDGGAVAAADSGGPAATGEPPGDAVLIRDIGACSSATGGGRGVAAALLAVAAVLGRARRSPRPRGSSRVY